MREGYLTGHGRFMIRAKANTETTKWQREHYRFGNSLSGKQG
jgi:DNA gyrase/topoisomerase IV subunit A